MTPPWHPVPLTLACSPDCRSPECLRAVLAQFDVARNPRYRVGQQDRGETYCNVFVWDATRALECEVPHWIDNAGRPVPVGRGHELSAAGMISWLRASGPEEGWREVLLSEARERATAGFPVVLTWLNPAPSHPSHVAMLLPDADGECRIAQAGARCLFDEPLARGFGAKPVTCFTHD